jgi:Flagellar protein FliS
LIFNSVKNIGIYHWDFFDRLSRTPYRLSFFGGGTDFPAWFRKGNSIQKALDILSELRAALDFEKGGEIATNLDGLYSFWNQHVIKADRNKDTRSLDQVASMLEEIKSALREAYFGHSENQTFAPGIHPFLPPGRPFQ